jgi:glycosyltransferase involved in cell wall biosynthesis
MRVALVHDYFTQLGGAEKVAEELYRMLPDASVFATVAFSSCMPRLLKNADVQTTWMQSLPKIDKYYRVYFLLYPFAIASMDLSKYDLVLSSSSSYAKGITANRDAIHVCYCHTPMRWVWSYKNYSGRESFGFTRGVLLPILIRGLRYWDEGASRQPDHFVANSRVVAGRIRRAYGRCAEVIHPPIDTQRFRASREREDYYVILSRLAPYKRIDLAIQACNERKKKLIVIGVGTDRKRLEGLAGPSITFLGRASDDVVKHCVSRCRALIFPGEEDFGMAPLEVAAAGRPTIAYRAGGALETIVENVTGIFFDRQAPEELGDAIERLEMQDWSPDELTRHSRNFGVQVFQDRFRSFLRRIGAPIDTHNSISTTVRVTGLLHGVGARD